MIYCLGESLYDIIFTDNQPQWAVPGGGMFNCAVSLGHSGTNVQLITELGNDKVGEIIMKQLNASGVRTDYIRISDNNTTLALAFLDNDLNANYQFYHSHPENAPVFTIPDFKQDDILVFGSLYSVNKRNRANITKMAIAARNAGALVFYDPNFRKSHSNKLNDVYTFILENVALADVVRGSDEDFMLITNYKDARDIYSFIKNAGCNTLILTKNKEGAELLTQNRTIHYDAFPVKVVSTIGAGDAFNAGILHQLNQLQKLPVTHDEWDMTITTGLRFAAEVCESKFNFIQKRAD